MATNEEGEFELVLGNKQLLSVFFIVVVLLGVFFTMGYIVGRSTTPAPTQVASIDTQPGPLVVDPPTSSGKPSPVGEPPAPPATRPTETASPKPEPVKPEPVKPEPAKPEPAKPEPAKPAPAKPAPAKPAPAKPEPPKPEPSKPVKPSGALPGGTYLQVVATKRTEAELLADVLRKKGFPAATEPVPDSILVRVLVGPLKDSATVSSTRTDLEGAGFKSILKRK